MNIRDSCIDWNSKIKDAIRLIELSEKKTIFVIDGDRFVGVINDGDARRGLLSGISEEDCLIKITNTDPITDIETAKKRIEKTDARYILVPIVDKDRKLIDCTVVTREGESKTNYAKYDRVLVIGGAGYLGSVLCRKLLKKGYHVRVLDVLLYGDDGIKDLYKDPRFEFNYGDMRDLQMLVRSLKDVDAVIHLAAIVGDPASALEPIDTIQSNYFATKMVAEVCKFAHISKFIFASTCSVYGASEDKRMLSEISKTNPVSLYADMKLKSEKALLEMKDRSFKPIIFRMGTLHGISPRMRFDLVVNLLTIRACQTNKFKIFGGEQHRAFCHVSDAADAYVKCLETSNSGITSTIYNLVSENMSIKELGELVKSTTGAKMEVEDVTDLRNYIVCGIWGNVTFDLNHKMKIANTITSIVKNMKKYKDFKDKKYSNVDHLKEAYVDGTKERF